MRRVVVLGSTGMLGHKVYEHFSNLEDYEVFGSYRNEAVAPPRNSFHFDAEHPDWSIIPECDYVLNCIGVIKPFMRDNIIGAIKVNSLFPWELSSWCESRSIRLIHITTDCVFSGNTGNYNEESLHDCLDDYGKSKSLGEPTNCMVLRTSIIGEEVHKNASLIAWAMSQKGNQVNGFTNHYWNGITTNQYAACCQTIIENDLYETGTKHIHSPDSVSKYELLDIISTVFDLQLTIQKFETNSSCDRTISSNFDLSNNLNIPSIRVQLNYLKEQK
jgi:dTDP-4-dehydrorhamnose reductase